MQSGISYGWADLTSECLLDIFSRLNMEQRWTGPMFVCKTWMNTCQDPSLNLVFDLETAFVSGSNSSNWWSPEFGEKVDTILRSVVDRSEGGLKEIRIRHCTNRSISYAAERCPNLEVLCIKYCPEVTDVSMKKIALNCPKLKELDISCSYEITCECMTMIAIKCTNIQILKHNLMDLSEVVKLQDTSFVPCNYLEIPSIMVYGNIEAHLIGKYMHELKHLELRFSTLNDKALAYICKTCLNLEYLDLFGCMNVTSVGVTINTSRLKNLKFCSFIEFI